MDCSLPGSPVHGDSPGKNTGVDCHFLLPGDLLDPRIEPESLASPALAGRFFTTSATWEAPSKEYIKYLNILQTAMQDSLWFKMYCQKSLKDCQSQIHMCPPQSFWYQCGVTMTVGSWDSWVRMRSFLFISGSPVSVMVCVWGQWGWEVCSYLPHQARRFSISSTISLEACQYPREDLGSSSLSDEAAWYRNKCSGKTYW